MTPSPQQQAVIDFVAQGSGSAFVRARAGTGKTTTLIQAIEQTEGYVSFAAYNTKIAKEITGKVAKLNLGNRVRVGTFHSFGLGGWKRAYPKVKFGPEAAREKYDMSVEQMKKHDVPEPLHAFVMKLVSHAKGAALGLYGNVEDKSKWHAIIDHHDMAYDLDEDPDYVFEGQTMIERGVNTAIRMLNWHRALGGTIIDFDDMLYLPVVSGIRLFQVDWIFVDEAQDTNPARRALARKMLKGNGRAVFVGDDRQAIYGFTGADSDAIDQIMEDFNCAELPLTVTYRCPKTVVAEANHIVPDIEAHESASEGNVRYDAYASVVGGQPTIGRLGTTVPAVELRADDALICRNTKPLVEAAYTLIKRGVACHVEGRDIGAGLIKLIDRYKVKSVEALRDKLTNFRETRVQQLIAKGKETQAEALADRIDTIFVLMDSQPPAATVAELRLRIKAMFVDGDDEPKPTMTLCTAHRSKGREWPRVFILGRETYMPSPFARQPWQLTQEANLEYVAITRAQRELIYVTAAPK